MSVFLQADTLQGVFQAKVTSYCCEGTNRFLSPYLTSGIKLPALWDLSDVWTGFWDQCGMPATGFCFRQRSNTEDTAGITPNTVGCSFSFTMNAPWKKTALQSVSFQTIHLTRCVYLHFKACNFQERSLPAGRKH